MKFPSLKRSVLWIGLSLFLCVLAFACWLLLIAAGLPRPGYLSDPGVSVRINVPDWRGDYFSFTVGPENPDWVPIERIPRELRNAVLAGEDFSFYYHKGVDWFELRESLLKDLRERRFARGASTITQQLAKNLFLSRDKSVKRKIRELILARRMEKELTKDRILELYLNVVELGDGVCGVGAGARYHFRKEPSELSLRESAFLAAMLPGPKVYDPDRRMDRVMNRSDHILGVMLKGRMITEDQYLAALVEIPFATEPSDPGKLQPSPESTPEIREEWNAPEQVPDPAEDSPAEKEIPDRHEGIVEIPINR